MTALRPHGEAITPGRRSRQKPTRGQRGGGLTDGHLPSQSGGGGAAAPPHLPQFLTGGPKLGQTDATKGGSILSARRWVRINCSITKRPAAARRLHAENLTADNPSSRQNSAALRPLAANRRRSSPFSCSDHRRRGWAEPRRAVRALSIMAGGAAAGVIPSQYQASRRASPRPSCTLTTKRHSGLTSSESPRII